QTRQAPVMQLQDLQASVGATEVDVVVDPVAVVDEHVDRLGDVVGAGEVTGAAHRVRGQREEHVDVRGQDRARDLHGVAVAAGTGHVSEVRGVPDPLLPRGDDLG